jgi:curved DNA-binding protein CbpA
LEAAILAATKIVHTASNSAEPQEVDNTKFYESLEISKNATQDEITKKYRELAKKYHPDRKGGSAEKVSMKPFSSKKSHKHMKRFQTLKREGSMTNLEPKVLSPTEAI